MPKVKVDDIQVYYEVKGEGYPLVMIIGFGVNLDFWVPHMIEELSKNFKVVTFDNRGTGRTDVSDKEYSIRLFADDTVGLMNALGISQANILGWSLGGAIAQELALSHPEKVKKLVLYSTTCGGAKSVRNREADAMIMRLLTGGMSVEEASARALRFNFTSDFIDSNPEFVELLIQRTLKAPTSGEVLLRQRTAIMNEPGRFDRLSGIKAPTLVLSGERDVLCPPENGSILAEAIPNAKLVFFEKSGHALLEDMEEVIHSITDFLL
jgi:pimeloyl-ACP methyl ester carboxylesterase